MSVKDLQCASPEAPERGDPLGDRLRAIMNISHAVTTGRAVEDTLNEIARTAGALAAAHGAAILLRQRKWPTGLSVVGSHRLSFAVVLGGLDQQPAGVRRPGLGDRSLPAFLIAGALGRDDPEEPQQHRRPLESIKGADFGAQASCGERLDPAKAAQPRDRLCVRAAGDGLLKRLHERDTPSDKQVDRGAVVSKRRLRTSIEGQFGIDPGATTRTSIPRSIAAHASPNPVGPAS